MDITDTQLRTLRDEAQAHGDLEMAAICDLARGDDLADAEDGTDYAMVRDSWTREQALARCAEVIADAQAMGE